MCPTWISGSKHGSVVWAHHPTDTCKPSSCTQCASRASQVGHGSSSTSTLSIRDASLKTRPEHPSIRTLPSRMPGLAFLLAEPTRKLPEAVFPRTLWNPQLSQSARKSRCLCRWGWSWQPFPSLLPTLHRLLLPLVHSRLKPSLAAASSPSPPPLLLLPQPLLSQLLGETSLFSPSTPQMLISPHKSYPLIFSSPCSD